MTWDDEVNESRKPDHPIDQAILRRWSPRAMTGEAITDKELMSLFEAARWAPSSYNGQPWRFVYAKKGTEEFDKFLSLLVEFNRQWCKNAAALVVLCSRNTFEHNDKPSRTHSFDTGSAWENLAIQGASMSLVVHGMEGFDYDKAAETISMPDNHSVEMMFAVGKHAPKESLPAEMQETETAGSERKKVEEFTFEASF